MIIRNAEHTDLPQILAIYQRARDYMRATGNPNQWKNTSPKIELLERDILLGQLYVLEEDGALQGVFALIPGQDPTYGYIEGQWLNGAPYATIHRIASAGQQKGILADCLQWCFSRYSNLRIDTHHDNSIMQHLLCKHGFTRCGVIYLESGEPRIAYQKSVP